MEKSFLSQDEIDALLGGDNQVSDNASDNAENNAKFLTANEQDVLSEIGNINVGAASTALSELLDQTVIINTPTLNYTTLSEIHQQFTAPYVLVEVQYTAGIEGNNLFILKAEDAAIIASIMMGGNGQNVSSDMDEFTLSAVSEAMNQMMGFSATSLSQMFKKTIEISPPQVKLISVEDDASQLAMDIFEPLVTISFKLEIGDLLESQIILIMSIDVAREHVKNLIADTAKELSKITPKAEETHKEASQSSIPQGKNLMEENTNLLLNSGNLNLILDVPLRLSVLLGRTKRSIADILKLTHGSIVELERLENEPVDILVNEKLIARGEVVVVKEYFGVRITEIISMENRLKNLVQK
jgi:flagellar motor switch protein FliN/FliY